MNRTECQSNRLSSRLLGLFLIPLSSLLALVSALIVPLAGLFFVLPLSILTIRFLMAPQSKACQLILSQQR